MTLTYLGTGASEGWPGLFCSCAACQKAQKLGGHDLRRRCGALLNQNLLLDLPPDLYAAKLALSLDLGAVEHALVTHQHPDHFYPAMLANRRPPFAENAQLLTVYGNRFVGSGVEALLQEQSDNGLELYLRYNLITPFEPFTAAGCTITPLLARHSAPESLVYLIEFGGKRLLYAHDTGLFLDETWEYLSGAHLDLVSLDCNNGPTCSEYSGHMGFIENRIVKERLLSSGACDAETVFIISHFSHGGGMCHDDMRASVEPDGFIVAYDGMTVKI